MTPRRAACHAGLLAALATSAAAQNVREIPFPHPVISEVLFSVPKDGDPNQDGVSNPVGDEFVELINPHDRPIDLAGYVIADKKGAASPTGGGGVRFRFPTCILQPGETALIFNGYLSHIPGPVGSMDRPPSRANERFNNAWVFSVSNTSGTCAFSNAADICVLVTPDAKPIDFLAWGPTEPTPPVDVPRAQYFKTVRDTSVQRPAGEGRFVLHREIDSKPFSPGRVPTRAGAGAKSGAPADPPATAEPAAPKDDPLIPRPRKKEAPAPSQPAPSKPR